MPGSTGPGHSPDIDGAFASIQTHIHAIQTPILSPTLRTARKGQTLIQISFNNPSANDPRVANNTPSLVTIHRITHQIILYLLAEKPTTCTTDSVARAVENKPMQSPHPAQQPENGQS